MHIFCICLHIFFIFSAYFVHVICIFFAYICIFSEFMCIFLTNDCIFSAYFCIFIAYVRLAAAARFLRAARSPPLPRQWRRPGPPQARQWQRQRPPSPLPTQHIPSVLKDFGALRGDHSAPSSLRSSRLLTPLSQPGFPPVSQLLTDPSRACQ